MTSSIAALYMSAALAACGGGANDGKGSEQPGDASDSLESGYTDDRADTGRDTGFADFDGDGYSAAVDCDESDPDVNPGAVETCDERDEDCDGEVDEDASDATAWYSDEDGDDYGDPATSELVCSRPAYAAGNGGDCDDTDPSVNPDGVEVCNDYSDNDCDGSGDGCRAEGQVAAQDGGWTVLVGGEMYKLGGGLGSIGDWDGDGVPEFFAGASNTSTSLVDAGALFVVPGDVVGHQLVDDVATAIVDRAGADVYLGYPATGAADLDADGVRDLALKCSPWDSNGYSPGRTCIMYGPLRGDVSVSEADAEAGGTGRYDYFGYALAGSGDVTQDGTDDLVVGAPGMNNSDGGHGVSFVLPGPLTGVLDPTVSGFRFDGEDTTGDSIGAGESACGPHDANGDGWTDVVVGGEHVTVSIAEQGAVYVVYGPATSDRALAGADVRIYGEHALDFLGNAIGCGGDLDGDGYEDLVVGADGESTRAMQAGAVYVFAGPQDGTSLSGNPTAKIYGGVDYDYAGSSVSSDGDFDGDGLDDLVIGSTGSDLGGDRSGALNLRYGPVSGTFDLEDDGWVVYGSAAGDYLGAFAAVPGDLSGDGADDLLVSAHLSDLGAPYGGAVYVMTAIGR